MKISYLVIDVDGTLTDGKIYMGNNGEIMKAFNIKDGCGIHDILIPIGIKPIIITSRNSKILEKRCLELGIELFFQGVANKLAKLWSIERELMRVAYIGDDINDLECMLAVKKSGGLVGCPKDANPKVKAVSDFISKYRGGDGAVREFIEWILEHDA